jgi:uncharacterized protein YajQ (UPF0234 family)
MPSFDIASKVDVQTLDNAINVVKKEIANRYDFKGNHIEIDLDKKTMILKLEVESDMKLQQVEDVIISKSLKQGLDAKCFDFSKPHHASGKYVRKEVTIRNGIEKEEAKKIVKLIKDSDAKVQVAIMDDIIRVTGKKIDDLQDVIRLCNGANLEMPLQYINMKS